MNYKLRKTELNSVEALEILKTAYKVKLEDTKSNFEWEKIVTLSNEQKTKLNQLGVVYKK